MSLARGQRKARDFSVETLAYYRPRVACLCISSLGSKSLCPVDTKEHLNRDKRNVILKPGDYKTRFQYQASFPAKDPSFKDGERAFKVKNRLLNAGGRLSSVI